MSASHDGYRSAPRDAIDGSRSSKPTWSCAIVSVGPQVAPPSVDVLAAIRLFTTSFQATCTSPFGETNGSAPMAPFLPCGISLAYTASEKVVPPSIELETTTPCRRFPPTRSHAT